MFKQGHLSLFKLCKLSFVFENHPLDFAFCCIITQLKPYYSL